MSKGNTAGGQGHANDFLNCARQFDPGSISKRAVSFSRAKTFLLTKTYFQSGVIGAHFITCQHGPASQNLEV
jgi:hypothetical protein